MARQSMTGQGNERERIFLHAVEIDSDAERAAFLRDACGDDARLLLEVEELLRHDAEAEGFLETPAVVLPREDSSPEVEIPDSVDGYRILGTLGEGGMGVIYRAEQVRPVRRFVALKLIKLGMDTREVVRRFESERNALALMDHPNVAHVFDAGAAEDGRPYFAMELIEGTPLDEYCDQHRLSIRERLELFRQVCRGVHHAHLRGVVHRDIKPANVLVNAQGDSPIVKIIDFGIAKAMNQRLTERTLYTSLGQVVGTPAYMSPEQAGSSPDAVDHRTDIYSLGVLLYELLVGELPLDWESASKAAYDEIVRRIRDEEPPTPSTRWSRLSAERSRELAMRRGSHATDIARLVRGELDWIVTRALEKEPGRRYATASELEADIARYLTHEPVLARPPGAVYRLRKFARRHRGFVVGSLSVVLALLIGLVAAFDATLRAKKAHRQAQEVVCDLYTESGLESAEHGDAASALLWFASALNVPHGDPDRQRATEARFAYWLENAAVPVRWLEHERQVYRVLFHPSSSYLLTIDTDARCAVWDLASGERLEIVPAVSKIADAAWSPGGDWLVLASIDGGVEVRTFPDGAVAHRIDVAPMSVQAIAFSPDGRFLALGGDGARVWSCESERFVSERLVHAGTVHWLGFDARGERLLTSADDQRARVYAYQDGAFGPRPLFDPVPHLVRYNIGGLSQSSEQWVPTFVDRGRGLLTIETPTRVAWWDCDTGAKVRSLPGFDRLLGVRPSPDGRLVAIFDERRTRFWNVARERFDDAAIDRDVVSTAAVWSPDGASILLAGADGSVEEWLPTPRRPSRLAGNPWRRGARVPRAAEGSILDYAPDGTHFATSDARSTVRVWRRGRAAGSGIENLPLSLVNRHVEVSADGRYAVQFGREGYKPVRSARVYDLESGLAASPELPLAGDLWESSFAPSGDLLETVCVVDDTRGSQVSARPALVEFWDWFRGRRLHALSLPSPPTASMWSLDGAALTLRCESGEILTMDRESGEVVARVAGDAEESVVFAPGGDELVSWRDGEPARILESRSGEERAPGFQEEVVCAAVRFSGGGSRLVTISPGGATRVWDYRSGRPLSPELPHPRRVHELDVEGDLLATHGDDEIVRVWRWPVGEIVGRPFRLSGSPSWVRFTGADARWLVTFTSDSGFQFWDRHTGQLVAALPHADFRGYFEAVRVGDMAIPSWFQVGIDAIVARLDRRFDIADPLILAQLLSGQALDHGNAVSLSDDEWRERRQSLAASERAPLSFDGSLVGRIASHRRLARTFEGAWNYDVAIWHSRALGEAALPEDLDARARLLSWVRDWRFAPEARRWRGAGRGADRVELDAISPDELAAIVASARAERMEHSSSPYIDFRARYPDQNSLSLGHALRVIRSREARRIRVLAGSDDTLRVWLNGDEIFADPRLGPAFADFREVELALLPGENVLLVEVGQSGGDWGLFVRLEDEEGRPLLLTDDGELLSADEAESPTEH